MGMNIYSNCPDSKMKLESIQIYFGLRIYNFITYIKIALRGEGGVQPQKMKVLGFVICCSPSFGVSKMGSFVFQLQGVVEI